jgi:hypothetical protein
MTGNSLPQYKELPMKRNTTIDSEGKDAGFFLNSPSNSSMRNIVEKF